MKHIYCLVALCGCDLGYARGGSPKTVTKNAVETPLHLAVDTQGNATVHGFIDGEYGAGDVLGLPSPYHFVTRFDTNGARTFAAVVTPEVRQNIATATSFTDAQGRPVLLRIGSRGLEYDQGEIVWLDQSGTETSATIADHTCNYSRQDTVTAADPAGGLRVVTTCEDGNAGLVRFAADGTHLGVTALDRFLPSAHMTLVVDATGTTYVVDRLSPIVIRKFHTSGTLSNAATLPLKATADDLVAESGGQIAVSAERLLVALETNLTEAWRIPIPAGATLRSLAAAENGGFVALLGDASGDRIWRIDADGMKQEQALGQLGAAIVAVGGGATYVAGSNGRAFVAKLGADGMLAWRRDGCGCDDALNFPNP